MSSPLKISHLQSKESATCEVQALKNSDNKSGKHIANRRLKQNYLVVKKKSFVVLCRQAVPGGVHQRCQKRPVHRQATPVRPQLRLSVLRCLQTQPPPPLAPPCSNPVPVSHLLCCYLKNITQNQCMMVLIAHIVNFLICGAGWKNLKAG